MTYDEHEAELRCVDVERLGALYGRLSAVRVRIGDMPSGARAGLTERLDALHAALAAMEAGDGPLRTVPVRRELAALERECGQL